MTATGWTFDELDHAQACDVMALLHHWIEEPPAHVSLARIAHFLGVGPQPKRKVNEKQAREDLASIGQIFGKQSRPMPDNLKAIMRGAEEMKRAHRGLTK